MVIHINKEADIRLVSPGFRKNIIDTIKMFYAAKTRDNLPIYGVRQQKLSEYTTQQGDVKKGISRIPLPLARLANEDLVKLDDMI